MVELSGSQTGGLAPARAPQGFNSTAVAANQKISGWIPRLHVEESLGKILNLKLLPELRLQCECVCE